MCSLNEDELDRAIVAGNDSVLSENSKCRKCNEGKANILLRGKDAYCEKCFLLAATHKFRATLGKSKIVRPNDSVLVAHSGSAGSTALLHLIDRGLKESAHKRLLFKTTVIYIDDGLVKNLTLEERISRVRKIAGQIKLLGFEGFVTNLAEIFAPEKPNLHRIESDFEPINFENPGNASKLSNAYNALKDATSREDFVSKLILKLLVSSSRELQCNKIFLGSSSSRLAIKTLENISLGRAAQLQNDVGFVDARFAGTLILRPMKDFTRTELSHYLNYFGLELISPPGIAENVNSIGKMTEKFVTELDAQFSGTVSAVFRISEKLAGSSNSEDSCAFCEGGIDTFPRGDEVSAIRATSFSREISNSAVAGSENCGSKETCCGGNHGKTEAPKMREISGKLCYGCRLIFRDVESVETVPEFVKRAAIEKMSLEKMRREIDEFLL